MLVISLSLFCCEYLTSIGSRQRGTRLEASVVDSMAAPANACGARGGTQQPRFALDATCAEVTVRGHCAKLRSFLDRA